ncbi:MAG: DUF3429 domain-containing protein [Neomegalonema sp.]|nr:DUF3429 domain-containing protein [Neomegalonema sp.]
MAMMNSSSPPVTVWIYGAAGLTPFFALAALAIALQDAARASALHALHIYGAVILSFLGGCRWGFSCAGYGDGATSRALAISVTPSLFAGGALWIGLPNIVGPLLAAGLAAMLIEDWRACRAGETPPWWLRLRIPLSAGAILALLAPTVAA